MAASPGTKALGEHEPVEAELPAGTVALLLTGIEGSTRLWNSVPEAMEVALERHNRLVTGAVEDYRGVVITSRGEGDRFFAVFPSAAGSCGRADSPSR